MPEQFADILDHSITAALGGASIADCCRRYPQYADELQPLLELALAGKTALAVEESPAAQTRTRGQLMARAGEQLSPSKTGWKSRLDAWRQLSLDRRRALGPVALAVALLALSAGTSLAAAAAGPDSVLYPLKQRLEDARTALATSNLDRASVEVGRAIKRLDEIDGMQSQGKTQYIPGLLAQYDSDMQQAQALVYEAGTQGEDTSIVTALVAITRQRHDSLLARLSTLQPGMEQQDDSPAGPSAPPPSAPAPPATPAVEPAPVSLSVPYSYGGEPEGYSGGTSGGGTGATIAPVYVPPAPSQETGGGSANQRSRSSHKTQGSNQDSGHDDGATQYGGGAGAVKGNPDPARGNAH